MDEGHQALTEAEQQQLNQQVAVEQAEAQTGQEPIARTATSDPDPTELDPRWDRDDLRQGKPPPAVKKHHLPRKIKIRRPRAKKGMPFKKSGEPGAEGASTDGEAEDAEMTDDEVEIEEVEEDNAGGGDSEQGEKKKGVFSKILGKNTTT